LRARGARCWESEDEDVDEVQSSSFRVEVAAICDTNDSASGTGRLPTTSSLASMAT